MKEATGAQILIHEADAAALEDARRSLLGYTGKTRTGPPADRLLKEGDVIEVGSTIKLKVIHTPGHTPGGICLDAGDVVFTGDTLFAGTVGRSDFPGGSHEQLMHSVRCKLTGLSDAAVVYPGHEGSSTMALSERPTRS